MLAYGPGHEQSHVQIHDNHATAKAPPQLSQANPLENDVFEKDG